MSNLPDSTISNETYENLPPQPEKIIPPLRKHQLAALAYCQKLETREPCLIEGGEINSQLGTISDIVGAGKSLVALSIISNQKSLPDKGMMFFQSYRDMYCSYMKSKKSSAETNYPFVDTNLLVVPHGIRHQWRDYIRTQTEGLTNIVLETKDLKPYLPYRYHKTLHEIPLEERQKYLKETEEKGKAFINNLAQYDVVILKNTLFRDFLELSGRTRYNRFIVDEADSIEKITYGVDANFLWFITSTPHHLFSANSSFIRRIFESYRNRKTILNHIVVKNANEIVESSLNLEEPIYHQIICRQIHRYIQILSGLISNDVIKMIHADNIKDAITTIDCEMIDEDNIIHAVSEKYEVELHNKKMELTWVENRIYKTAKTKTAAIERVNNDIAEIEKKIGLIKERVERDDICNICFCEPENKVILKCCHHGFCFKCIMLWLNQKTECPYCRHPLQKKDILMVTDKQEIKKPVEEPKSPQLPSKMDQLFKIIEGEGKILIFASYDGSLEHIKTELSKKSIKFAQLVGTGAHIQKIIHEYKNGDLNIILLNSQYFGAGFNLENTTDVVIYHKMEERDEKQAIGRAQRFGRQGKLNIWKLIYPDE